MGTPAQHDRRDRFLLDVMRGTRLRGRKAEDELLLSYSPQIRVRVERRLGGRHAQGVSEVHQDALQRFQKVLHKEPAPATPLLPFAFSCANYATKEFFERLSQQRETVSLDEQPEAPAGASSDPERLADDRAQLMAIFTWVNELGEPDKTIATRCIGGGAKSAEVASDLNMTENAVNKRRVRLNTSITELQIHG